MWNLIFVVIPQIVTTVCLALSLLIGIFMLIPGDEPEATLKRVLKWLREYSRK